MNNVEFIVSSITNFLELIIVYLINYKINKITSKINNNGSPNRTHRI